jgi:hypothetical protein
VKKIRVFLKLLTIEGPSLEALQTLPFSETFSWTAFPQTASGKYSTSNTIETKVLFERALQVLSKKSGSGKGKSVWAHLRLTVDESSSVGFSELQGVPFRRGFTLHWGQKLVSDHSTSNSRETTILLEKVSDLLKKHQRQ